MKRVHLFCATRAFTLLCGLLPAGHAVSEELGRLFFTPQERAQLNTEYSKRGNSMTRTGEITLNGIVQKHGGSRTVWVNGQAQSVGKEEHDPSSAQITLPGQSHPIKIKVGERNHLSADKNRP